MLIGNSLRESNPSNIYVFNSPLSSVTLDQSPPMIGLSNGGPLSTMYPSLYKSLDDLTVRNRTVIINDSVGSYLLLSFDTNGTQTPLLYNIDQEQMVDNFKGGTNMQTMLNAKYQVGMGFNVHLNSYLAQATSGTLKQRRSTA